MPVAVLVIDQNTSTVVYANTAAVELAGNVGLPVDIDTWGAAAGLTDLGGGPLASSVGPLSAVAQGRPVAGEAVRMAPGTSTEQQRAADDLGDADQLLWVTGFPLSQTDSDQSLALVVFLHLDPLEETEDPDAYLQALRERAVIATDITFAITDPREPDNPLVWVNPSFTRVTGYESDDVVGRNCRFLQGPATDPAAVAEIRTALAEHRTVTTTLLNYRKDGTPFWNQLSVSPVFDGEGTLVSFVGVQTDVTERVRVEREREAAFAAEQAARREAELARAIAEQARSDAEKAQSDAERAQGRLALMAEATSTLSATLDMAELLDRLAGALRPEARRLGLRHPARRLRGRAPVRRPAPGRPGRRAAGVRRPARAHLGPGSPSRRSMALSRPVLLDELPPDVLAEVFTYPGALEAFQRLGGTQVLTVPMVARRRTLGAIALIRSDAGRGFTQDDVHLAADLGRPGGARDRQRPALPAGALGRRHAPALPAAGAARGVRDRVGRPLRQRVVRGRRRRRLLRPARPPRRIRRHRGRGRRRARRRRRGGHGPPARSSSAPSSGRPRTPTPPPCSPAWTGWSRACGWPRSRRSSTRGPCARPREGAPWRVHIANAGHPPVLLRHPNGSVQILAEVTGMLVGVDVSSHRESVVLDVPRGSTLVAYTDGLIEQPGRDMDEGIHELCERIMRAPQDANPRELCDAAVSGALDHRDDVALIAVRFD